MRPCSDCVKPTSFVISTVHFVSASAQDTATCFIDLLILALVLRDVNARGGRRGGGGRGGGSRGGGSH